MNPQQYARAWQKRARDYGPAMKREFRAIGELALQVSDRLITAEIYSKPEDLTASGKPKWRRTNFLAVSERLRFDEDGTLAVLENLAVYAHRRHEANKPGYEFHVAAHRTAHWRDDMLTILGQEITPRLQRLQLAVLRQT